MTRLTRRDKTCHIAQLGTIRAGNGMTLRATKVMQVVNAVSGDHDRAGLVARFAYGGRLRWRMENLAMARHGDLQAIGGQRHPQQNLMRIAVRYGLR